MVMLRLKELNSPSCDKTLVDALTTLPSVKTLRTQERAHRPFDWSVLGDGSSSPYYSPTSTGWYSTPFRQYGLSTRPSRSVGDCGCVMRAYAPLYGCNHIHAQKPPAENHHE